MRDGKSFIHDLLKAGLLEYDKDYIYAGIRHNSHPSELKQKCRKVVMNCMQNIGLYHFQKLTGVPQPIREYLMLYDFMGYNPDHPSVHDLVDLTNIRIIE